MNRQRWIDGFFRERLEQRTFPVEQGEFEEVQALIRKRNTSTLLTGGGGISKWWLSALIPVVAVLWWALAGNIGEPEVDGAMAMEQGSSTEQNGVEQQVVLSRKAILSERAGLLPDEEDGAGPADGATSSVKKPITEGDRATVAEPIERNAPQSKRQLKARAPKDVPFIDHREPASDAHPRPQQKLPSEAVLGQGNALSRTDSHEAAPNATEPEQEPQGSIAAEFKPLMQNGQDPFLQLPELSKTVTSGEQLSEGVAGSSITEEHKGEGVDTEAYLQVKNGPTHQGQVGASLGTSADVPLPLHVPVSRTIDEDQNASTSEITMDLSTREVVAIMMLRAPLANPVDPPQPGSREIEPFKLLAMGELHFFGAPLAVRARLSDGERTGTTKGSLFGLEYRVNTKRFSWATGIYYGSYAIEQDQASTDVELSFVEVPLLASYKFGRGRFGVLLQGGLSVDLLFNANGRYPVAADLAGAGFPDQAFNTANYSWILRPQATYHVDERLSLTAGPLWKAQLGHVANEGPLDGANISSSGASFGITWRLERSTF